MIEEDAPLLPIPPLTSDAGLPPLPQNSPAFAISPSVGGGYFRQEPPVKSTPVLPPWRDAFTLGYGEDGAKITQGWLEWCVTTLTFEKKFIYDTDGVLLEDVNGLVSQDSIEGVEVLEMAEAAEFASLKEWLQLDWFGDVWAVIELDESTGKPVALTIEGPDEPAMRPIPKLNEDLSRGSSSGSGDRCGYTVKIGNVTDGQKIEQEHVGNLYWFITFVPESQQSSSGSSSGSSSTPSSGSSSGGSSAPSGGSSTPGSSGGSSKDTAIVPGPDGNYVKWYAMEASQVLFFDFQEFELPQGKHSIEVDPVVSFCCEPGTLRAWTSPDVGTCHATVSSERIKLTVRTSRKKQRVQVMLKGIRRDFLKVRNEHATFDDFVDNECRLRPRESRKQIIEKLAKLGVTK